MRSALKYFAAAGLVLAPGSVLGADYFAGKTITVEVPSGSGGTYHVYCQIVQYNLGRHIPGNPSMIIKNRPGAGGLVSASYMANVAKKDGTEIAMIAPGTLTLPLMRKVKFDGQKFNFLGSVAARSAAIWVWHTKGVRKLEDLKKVKVKIASSSYSSAGSVIPRMVNKIFGTNIEVIYGYKGGGAMNVAIERGESDGRWNYPSGFASVRPKWIPEKMMIPVIATGPRDPVLKGVPHMRDLLKEGSIEQKVYDVFDLNFQVGQAFYAPPGVNPEALKILRTAFDKMLADPKTLQMIRERRIELSPKSAKEVHAAMDRGFAAAKPEVVSALKEIFLKGKK